MRYKILVTGENKIIIDDFFSHMEAETEVQSTSTRYRDILCHLQYFQPDVFVYCIQDESREVMSRMVSVKKKLSKLGIAFVIIGEYEECIEFNRETENIADLMIFRPLTAKNIKEQLEQFIRERRRQQEEEAQMLEEMKELMLQKKWEHEEARRRKHILIVDDDPALLHLLREYLYESYDVTTALSGEIARTFLEERSTDLVLLDYDMPEENGIAVFEKIRSNPKTAELPVVFLAGATDKEGLQKALALKPQGYLIKPIERDKLFETIAQLLGPLVSEEE
jgi:CheY-like chemotaxis protein